MEKKQNKNKIFFIIFLIFGALIWLNAFTHIRATLTDKLYGANEALNNIIIIQIDDPSITQIGRWPWERKVFATLLNKIKDSKAIGIDISFFEQSKSDNELKKIIKENKKIVLAAEINEDKLYKPIFDSDYGYVNIITDDDGVTRKINLNLDSNTKAFTSQLYKKILQKNHSKITEPKLINFASPKGFVHYSTIDVLKGNYSFKDKIVLIGATAPDLHDNYFVPTSQGIAMSGVEVHANILQNLILNNFLNPQGNLSILLIVLITGILCAQFVSKQKTQLVIPIVIASIVIYYSLSIFLFTKFNYVLDLFFFPASILVFTGAAISVNYFEEKQRNAFLTNAFGKYISKDLLKQIIAQKHELKLGGHKSTITIFFSDIRGFTSISEKLTPEQLVSLLNDYLNNMTKIILEHHGTLDKFIGDAIMAFWNAPLLEEKHAQLACTCSIAQVKTLKKLQPKWQARGLPNIEIGCGLNTGDAIVGNMGSKDRFDYTAISDTVNLASRLEGLTKTYGVYIVISETTHSIIHKEFTCRKLDAVKVKGKKIPVTIYELCIEQNEKFIKTYEKALEKYFERKFKEAIKDFKTALNFKEKDVSCELFILRCETYLQNPPPKDWDGSYEMKTK